MADCGADKRTKFIGHAVGGPEMNVWPRQPLNKPKGKCERGSQTLTHLEAHKDKQYVQTVTCLSYPGKLLIVVHIIDGF